MNLQIQILYLNTLYHWPIYLMLRQVVTPVWRTPTWTPWPRPSRCRAWTTRKEAGQSMSGLRWLSTRISSLGKRNMLLASPFYLNHLWEMRLGENDKTWVTFSINSWSVFMQIFVSYRQTCKEDMFKWTVTGLIKRTETVLKQNNTMNIEEIYFEGMKKSEDSGSSKVLFQWFDQ